MRKIFVLTLMLLSGYFLKVRGQELHFRRAEIKVRPEPETSSISGEVTYSFQIGIQGDSLRFDAVNMDIEGIWMNAQPTPWNYNGSLLSLKAPTQIGWHELKIIYRATPAQSLYFVGWEAPLSGKEQIWTQGQGKYSSHWVPSFNDMNQKVEFDLSVVFAPGYTVLANGKLSRVTSQEGQEVWEYDMQKPMSSYLLALAIGKFSKFTEVSESGIPLQMYYPEGLEQEAKNAYVYTSKIFDFLEQEINFPYPWEVYKQVPVRDFMYAGMENTGLTLFSDTYLVDDIGNRDHSYVQVNAHEMAHQWFGNLVTETDGASHWLHEGFASFYAALAEEHIFGKDHLTWKLYETANQLLALDQNQQGAALINPQAGSLIFYEKGAWALFALRDFLGAEIFNRGIQQYLTQYAYKNATVDDFLEVMQETAGVSLINFRASWLESKTFPRMEALHLLKQRSETLRHVIDFKDMWISSEDPPSDRQIREIWGRHEDPEFKATLIKDFLVYIPRDLILEVLESEAPVIQAELLSSFEAIEPWLIPCIEKYLEANTYEVRYQAFLRLWLSVPLKRPEYLQRMLDNGSLDNLKIRQLWWTLSLLTNGYLTPIQFENHITSLRNTTHSSFNWEIRMHAFQWISQIEAFDSMSIENLIQGTEHHAWQFKLFCRRLLDEEIKENPDVDFWGSFLDAFSEGSFPYFYSKIRAL